MAAQRNLCPATHANAIDGRDDRFGAGFKHANQIVQCRRLHRDGLAEFTNIRAPGQHPIGAGDHDGPHVNGRQRTLQSSFHTLAGRQAHAVDGWIINRDDGDIFLNLIASGHFVFS